MTWQIQDCWCSTKSFTHAIIIYGYKQIKTEENCVRGVQLMTHEHSLFWLTYLILINPIYWAPCCCPQSALSGCLSPHHSVHQSCQYCTSLWLALTWPGFAADVISYQNSSVHLSLLSEHDTKSIIAWDLSFAMILSNLLCIYQGVLSETIAYIPTTENMY